MAHLCNFAAAAVCSALLVVFMQGCGGTVNSTGSSSCVGAFVGPEVVGQEVTVDSATEVAQSFKVAATSAPANIQLKLKAVGTPAGSVFVRLEPDLSGAPSGLVIENASISASTILPAPAADAYYNFVFSPAQTLSAGTYWIVLKGNSSFTSTGVNWMGTNVAGAYSGGSAVSSTNDSIWSSIGAVSGKAFLFQLGC